jgi:O-methyltransferase
MVSQFQMDNKQFLRMKYLEILRREPDQEGFDYYLSKLDRKELKGEDIISIFKTSEEYKMLKNTPEKYSYQQKDNKIDFDEGVVLLSKQLKNNVRFQKRVISMIKPIKATVQRLAYHFGFEIHHIPKSRKFPAGVEYAPVTPAATYSPWNKDCLFQQVYALVQGYTLVDKYRCYELWKLIEQSAKLNNGSIIEIGVWRGGTGALIAGQAKKCDIGDKVFLCDTFTGVEKAGPKDSSYKGGEHADTTRQVVEELIFKRMNLDNVEILEGIFPDQTAHLIEGCNFRFYHIDVDVYQSAKDIVDWIWDRIVPGGMVVYDDYGFESCDGITKYVEEQMNFKDRLIFHNLNGHAIILKL